MPSMAVSADLGGSASLALALDSEPAVRAQLCWALEPRRLAFDADGAPQPVADARGAALSTTIDVDEGEAVAGEGGAHVGEVEEGVGKVDGAQLLRGGQVVIGRGLGVAIAEEHVVQP